MTAPNRQHRLIHVRRPVKWVEVAFEPTTPLHGTLTDGPLIPVGRPLKRVGLHSEQAALAYVELALQLVGGADGPRMFEKLNSLVVKVNEMESLFDRAGVWLDGSQSGVRDGKVVIVLTPNDPADAIETCKRVADQLFATTRPLAGMIVTVRTADQLEKPLYQLAS